MILIRLINGYLTELIIARHNILISMKEQLENWRKTPNRDYRRLLSTFKTQLCQNKQPHYIEYCEFYHFDGQQKHGLLQTEEDSTASNTNILYYDRRRSPYNQINQFVYEGVMCDLTNNCQNQEKCRKCHNIWEHSYHPDNFKTMNCQMFYDCSYGFCQKLHYADYIVNQKTHAIGFAFSEFFRFNLDTFKTRICQKQYSHQKSFCFFYHSSKDYRRSNFQQYQHTQCPTIENKSSCHAGCPFSHNKIQQLYHPRRYKSKFCEKHYISRKNSPTPDDETSFRSLCPFGKLCSFAHNDEEITITLIDKAPKNLEFYLYVYKTVWCPITTEHNRFQCVYAHNIQDFRRNPKEKYYQPIECPFWKKNQNIKCLQDAGCPAGIDCNKCHGWKQKQYHPIIYCKVKPGQLEKSDSHHSHEAKSKTDSDPKKDFYNSQLNDAIVTKKLESSSRNNNLEQIVEKQLKKGSNLQNKQKICLPGTPFFKNSKPAKRHTQSETGDSATKETDDKMSQKQERGSSVTTKSIVMKSGDSYLKIHIEDEDLFKVFQKNTQELVEQENFKEEKIERTKRTISKSLGCRREKSKNFYSKDITQVLSPQIIGVLQSKNISQIKLINMRQTQIKSIEQLTKSQKNLIIHKIISSRNPVKKSPTYEQSLVKLFTKHKKDQILAKMKTKNVKQEKLLLLDSEIYDLSFLTENEKEALPEILRQATNHRDFQSLNEDIAKTINHDDQ